MSELAKTSIFAGVAAVALALVLLLGTLSQSWLPAISPEEMIGKQLFDDFDPLAVTSFEITKYDENTGTLIPFTVAEAKNKYSIPSHDNYPADAKDQLAEAAGGVLGRKVLRMASDNPGDHSLYGVLDPTSKDLKAGATGVGTRVTMKDKGGKALLDLIIGKEVPGNKGESMMSRPTTIYYVRRPGQDVVYEVDVNPNKLSAKFEDWIEKDLLKLSTWDISQLMIRDYSVDEGNRALIQRAEMLLAYNDTGEPKWKMVEDKAFEQGKWAPVQMAADEELDTTKLDAMKTALGDLKIVDVRRKPAGLSADLKTAKDFGKSDEAFVSLATKGFHLAQIDDREELVSNEGDVRCLMKDGVQYVLRFGNTAAESQAPEAKDEAKDKKDAEGKKEEPKKSGAGVNRYIFVMAEFNSDIIPKPQLEKVPDAAKPADKADKAEAKPEAKEAEKKPEAKDEKKPEAKEAEKKPEAKDDKKPDAKDEKKPDTKAEAERIEKENKRKQDEYDQKIADGKKKVAELNARFADWYYIISDEVYQKIHLGRKDIVKKKEKKEEKKEAGKADEAGKPGETGQPADAGQPAHDHTDDAAAKDAPKPAEPAGTTEEFNKLKQEGPAAEK